MPTLTFPPISQDGKTLYMPKLFGSDVFKNMEIPSTIYEESAIQKYPLGTKLVEDTLGGMRVFRYAKAGGTISLAHRCVCNPNQTEATNDYTTQAAMVVGDVTVEINDTDDTNHTVNFWAGGWCELWVSSRVVLLPIKSSTASDGSTCTITFAYPVPIAAAASSQATCHANPFQGVKAMPVTSGYDSAVGVPVIPMTSAYYGWVQTWGPVFISPTGDWALATSNYKDVYLHSDGTYTLSTATRAQRLGYAYPSGNYGTGLIMLQLQP